MILLCTVFNGELRTGAFLGRAVEARRFAGLGPLDLACAFVECRLVEAARGVTGRAFCLAARTFVALRARAFPAGERLVAGLRRVDLPATTRLRDDDDVSE